MYIITMKIDPEVILIVVVICAVLYMFMKNKCGCQNSCDSFSVGAPGRTGSLAYTTSGVDDLIGGGGGGGGLMARAGGMISQCLAGTGECMTEMVTGRRLEEEFSERQRRSSAARQRVRARAAQRERGSRMIAEEAEVAPSREDQFEHMMIKLKQNRGEMKSSRRTLQLYNQSIHSAGGPDGTYCIREITGYGTQRLTACRAAVSVEDDLDFGIRDQTMIIDDAKEQEIFISQSEMEEMLRKSKEKYQQVYEKIENAMEQLHRISKESDLFLSRRAGQRARGY